MHNFLVPIILDFELWLYFKKCFQRPRSRHSVSHAVTEGICLSQRQPFRCGWQLSKLLLCAPLLEVPTALWGCRASASSFVGWSLSGPFPMACPPCLKLLPERSLKQVESYWEFFELGSSFWVIEVVQWQRFTQSSLYGSATHFALESTIILWLLGLASQLLGTGGITIDLEKSVVSKFDSHIINSVCAVDTEERWLKLLREHYMKIYRVYKKMWFQKNQHTERI